MKNSSNNQENHLTNHLSDLDNQEAKASNSIDSHHHLAKKSSAEENHHKDSLKTINEKVSSSPKLVFRKSIIRTEEIEKVVNDSATDKIPIRDVINAMDSVGFGLVLMIFAIAIVIPTPPPFPSIISIPMVIFSFQMAIGYSSPKLPKRFFAMSVKRSVLVMLIQKSSLIIRKIERFLKPRLSFMNNPLAEKIVGGFILVFSSFVLMPLPLSNFIPGLGILIISFGILAKDGLVTILGIATGITGIAASITLVIFGIEILKHLTTFFH